MINLMNGYRIKRPDEKNFVLEHYEEVSKKVMDEHGKPIKEENAHGKLVTKTIKQHDWAFKGYYGTLTGLLDGMVTHNTQQADISVLGDLTALNEKCIKSAIKEIKLVAKNMEIDN